MSRSQRKLTATYPSVKKTSTKRKIFDENVKVLESSSAPSPPHAYQSKKYGIDQVEGAFHLVRPTRLLARDEEIKKVYGWLDNHLKGKEGGSLYICGAPGTGKTAVVTHCLSEWNEKHGASLYHQLFANCMNINANTLLEDMVKVLSIKKNNKGETPLEKVQYKLASKHPRAKMLVLVLDEMDQLASGKGTEVLYELFQTSRLPTSKLIIIGIANALDITHRHLPLLEIEKNQKRDKEESSTFVINFPTYEKVDIERILEDRLMEIGEEIFEAAAIKFIATKVAATTGDLRKALNACKSALHTVEKHQRQTLKETSDDGFNFSSPKKRCLDRGGKINVGMVSKVFAPTKDEGPLPLQQMITLATLLRLSKNAKNKVNGVSLPIPLSQLYDEYRKVCGLKGFLWIERSDLLSVCNMLQDRNLVTVVENQGGRRKSTFHTANNTGFMINLNDVENIVMSCDMNNIKAIVSDL